MFHKQVKILNFSQYDVVYPGVWNVTDTANINNQLYEKMVSNTFYLTSCGPLLAAAKSNSLHVYF